MYSPESYFAPSIGAPGLQIFVEAGFFQLNGVANAVASSYVGLSPSTTNYVFLSTVTGMFSVNTTGFPSSDSYPIAEAVTGTSGVIALTDSRPDVASLAPSVVNAATGFQINGAAASGQFLRGNGTDFVSSAIQPGDIPVANASGGVGGFFSDGWLQVPLATATASNPINTATSTVNSVVVYRFILPVAATLSRATISVIGTSAGNSVSVAIYSGSGSLLVDGGGASGFSTASTAVLSNTFSSSKLPPGTYFFAQTASSTAPTVVNLPLSNATIFNKNVSNYGVAANLWSAGFPSTLGTITSSSSLQARVFAYWDQA